MKRSIWLPLGVAMVLVSAGGYYLNESKQSSPLQISAISPEPEQNTQPSQRSSTGPRETGKGDETTRADKPGEVFVFTSPDPRRLQLDHDLLALATSKGLDAALSFIKSHYPPKDHEIAMRFLLGEIGKSNFDAAAALFPKFSSKHERQAGLAIMAASWIQKDPENFFNLVNGRTSGTLKNELLQQGVNVLVNRKDWTRGSGLINQMPFSRERSQSIGNFATFYAMSDADGALSWASSLGLPEDRASAQRSIVSGLQTSGNLAALKVAVSKLPPEARGDAIQAIGQLALSQGASIRQLIAEQANLPGSTAPILIGAIDNATPEQLSTVVFPEIQNINDSNERARVAARFAKRLFEFDQNQAVGWMMKLQGRDREAAIRVVVSKWYQTDSIQLSDWVNGLPPGNDQDTARESIVGQLRNTDRSLAKEVANTIRDQGRRDSVLRSLP